jgi:hypothetical protein
MLSHLVWLSDISVWAGKLLINNGLNFAIFSECVVQGPDFAPLLEARLIRIAEAKPKAVEAIAADAQQE